MPGLFKGETATRKVRLMHVHVKITQNGRNKVFRGKQTTRKVPLMVLDVTMLKERYVRNFLML